MRLCPTLATSLLGSIVSFHGILKWFRSFSLLKTQFVVHMSSLTLPDRTAVYSCIIEIVRRSSRVTGSRQRWFGETVRSLELRLKLAVNKQFFNLY